MSKVQDHEPDVLFMFGEQEVDVSFPGDVAFGVSGSIHVVGSDLFVKLLQGELHQGNEARINETSSGATVDDGSGFDDLVIYRDFYGNA